MEKFKALEADVVEAARGMSGFQWLLLFVGLYLAYQWARENKDTVAGWWSRMKGAFKGKRASEDDSVDATETISSEPLTPRQERKVMLNNSRIMAESCIARGDSEGAKAVLEIALTPFVDAAQDVAAKRAEPVAVKSPEPEPVEAPKA